MAVTYTGLIRAMACPIDAIERCAHVSDAWGTHVLKVGVRWSWGNEVVGKDHLVLAQLVKRVGSAGEHHKQDGRGVQQLSCLLAAQTPRSHCPPQRRAGASRAEGALVSFQSLHSLLHPCPLRARLFPTWHVM
jgi:hypothetical protein